MASPSLSLSSYVSMLRRQARFIVLLVVLACVLGSLPAALEEPMYATSARVRVSPLGQQGVFDTDQDQPAANVLREISTEVEILRSATIRQKVLVVFGGDPPEFAGPDVSVVDLTEVIDIRVVSSDPAVAAEVANQYAETFVDDRRDRSVQALVEKSNELRSQGAAATAEFEAVSAQLGDPSLSPSEVATLQVRQTSLAAQIQEFGRRADELDVEAALREGGTTIVSPADIRPDPISPNLFRALAISFVLGVLGAFAAAVVRDLLQDRLTGADDMRSIDPSIIVLATVPHIEGGTGAGHARATSSEAQEGYRYLRTSLRFHALETGLRAVAVTSALSGEGKSTTALNLARAAHDAGMRVALIDCDLRRPSLHHDFGVGVAPGVTTIVLDECSVAEAVRYPDDNIALVTAGIPMPNASELLGSKRFAQFVNGVVAQADLTILDVPPVLPVADPLLVGKLVDGVLMVSRVGKVRRKELVTAIERLREANVPIVGLVVNDAAEGGTYAGYEPADPAEWRTPADLPADLPAEATPG